jgi:hypothetical protein
MALIRAHILRSCGVGDRTSWYPPFCVVADLVIPGPVLAGWI